MDMSTLSQPQMAKQITFRINDDLERRLETYMASDEHQFQPNQSDVMRVALDEFLPEDGEP
jgi:Arc/MetJ-type ribon-helix-helix transcriptional regulator